MRSLLLLSAITLFFSSCSNQEEIEKYQRQLRESNEALEEVIEFRMADFRMKAAENPTKAKEWYELSKSLHSYSYLAINGWDIDIDSSKAFLVKLKNELEIEPFGIDPSDSVQISDLGKSDSLVLKNRILIYLSSCLKNLSQSTTGGGFITPEIYPLKFQTGDSTMILLSTNFIPLFKNSVKLNNLKDVSFKPYSSVGYFFLPNKRANAPISGQVEFADEATLSSFTIEFYTDTTNGL